MKCIFINIKSTLLWIGNPKHHLSLAENFFFLFVDMPFWQMTVFVNMLSIFYNILSISVDRCYYLSMCGTAHLPTIAILSPSSDFVDGASPSLLGADGVSPSLLSACSYQYIPPNSNMQLAILWAICKRQWQKKIYAMYIYIYIYMYR